MSEDRFNLERFVREQEHSYDRAYQGEGVPVALLFEPTGAKRRPVGGEQAVSLDVVDISADCGFGNDIYIGGVFDQEHGGGEGISRASGAWEASPGHLDVVADTQGE